MEIDILISKFLCGEATEKEIAELDKWRQSSIANENEFVNLRDSWSYIHQDSPNLNPDKEKVWNKILSHIIADHHQQQSYSRPLIYKVVTAAAVIAVLICVTVYIYVGSEHTDSLVCFKAPVGQKAEVTLPDGTDVLLNSGTTLMYSTDYTRTNRKVKLMGQAFFNVVKDKTHPFEVYVKDIKVVAYGTSFDVKGYEANSDIVVSLLIGHVGIFDKTSDKLMADLKPNQKFIISLTDAHRNVLTNCVAEDNAVWRLDKLKIRNESLYRIADKMEAWYGVRISLSNIDTSKKYWMTIKNESLDEMLEIINRITPIKYSIRGKEVCVRGNKLN